MTSYMLDTNICIEVIRGRGAAVLDRLRALDVGDALLSVITVAELEHGAAKSAFPDRNRVQLAKFCSPFEILPFDGMAAGVYGEIRAYLERDGKSIGPLDTLIAAHALSTSAILVTNNEREFRRVPDLPVENWL